MCKPDCSGDVGDSTLPPVASMTSLAVGYRHRETAKGGNKKTSLRVALNGSCFLLLFASVLLGEHLSGGLISLALCRQIQSSLDDVHCHPSHSGFRSPLTMMILRSCVSICCDTIGLVRGWKYSVSGASVSSV